MKQAGIGQEYIVSVNICWDSTYFIFMAIQEEKIGIIIIAPIIKAEEQQIAVAFADDTDFTTNGENCKEKMQKIIE